MNLFHQSNVLANAVIFFDAKNMSNLLCTEQIQKAVDYVSSQGGGEVVFLSGIYRTTTIHLRDNVTLHLKAGAVIEASTIQKDWESVGKSPVVKADSVSNIGIRGEGEIVGSADCYMYLETHHYLEGARPENILYFEHCNHINVSGITFYDSVSWTQHYYNCEYVTIDHVVIRNPSWAEREWTDGIDINACRHVVIKNCDIETGDDAICLKNYNKINPTSTIKDMYDIVVKDCVVASTCNATKIGTETVGHIHGVVFDGITIKKHFDCKRNNITAISVQSNDHNKVYDITFKNYIVFDCDTPIFILLQNRQSYTEGKIGQIYNIIIDNFKCYKSSRASQINAAKSGKIKNIILKDIWIYNYEVYQGTETPKEPDGGYPDADKYGRMPVYGLFARNTEELKLEGIVELYDAGDTNRPKMCLQAVKGLDTKFAINQIVQI